MLASVVNDDLFFFLTEFIVDPLARSNFEAPRASVVLVL